jgi:hypothetical protein
MRKLNWKIGILCAVLLVARALPAQRPGTAAVEGSLVLTADPSHPPVVLSPTDFHALPHITITVHNSHTNATETYSGIPLATLLEKVNAPLGKELHGDAMTSYLVATGSDGYSVVLSLAEADPSFHGGQVLVADARDGQSLGKSGPFQLIVSDDKRPARWVHNLVSITLQRGRRKTADHPRRDVCCDSWLVFAGLRAGGAGVLLERAA